jgi:ABC-2 type transport system permease protein
MTPSYQLGDLGWRALHGQAPDLAGLALLAGYTALFGGLVAWRYRTDERRR